MSVSQSLALVAKTTDKSFEKILNWDLIVKKVGVEKLVVAAAGAGYDGQSLHRRLHHLHLWRWQWQLGGGNGNDDADGKSWRHDDNFCFTHR